MKKTKRIISALLCAAILLVSLPVMLASAAGSVIWEMEAEDTPFFNTGTKLPDSMLCVSNSLREYVIAGTNFDMEAGNYQYIIYSRLLEMPSNPDAHVATIELFGTPEGSTEAMILAQIRVTAKEYAEAGTFQVNTYDFTLSRKTTGIQFRLLYENYAGMEFDKYMIVTEDFDEIEPADQDLNPDLNPPRGDNEVHDEYTVPLTEGAFISAGDYDFGTYVDGRLEINKGTQVRGGTTGLQDRFWMSSGTKTAQFYLRTPQDIRGEFVFFKISVTSAGIPVRERYFTGDDFTGYGNQTYLLELTFNANEDEVLDIRLDWYGNHSIIIDRIVFAQNPGSDSRTLPMEGTEEDGVWTSTLDAQTVNEVSAIDMLTFTRDDITVRVPAANVLEWLRNYESVEFVIQDLTAEQTEETDFRVEGYQKPVYKVGSFSLGVTLVTANGTRVTLDDLDNPIEIVMTIPQNIISQVNHKKIFSLSYQYNTAGDLQPVFGTITNNSTITLRGTYLKGFYIGIVDMTQSK